MTVRLRGFPAGQRPLLQIAVEVLLADPRASLADVAAASGMSRTTLYSRYPTREALLVAVAHDSVEQFEKALEGAGVTEQSSEMTAVAATRVLRRLVEVLVPLGARVEYLLRQPSLDTDKKLATRLERLDRSLEAFVRRTQEAGALRAVVPAWWVVSSLYALTYSAWEGVTRGRLAALDAPELTFDTLLAGLGGSR
jgi:AcrR family transcriptional regulator